MAGVTISGAAEIAFNDTGAEVVNLSVVFTDSSGQNSTIVLDQAIDTRSFKATNVNLDVAGQRLSGDFAFDSTGAGTAKELTIEFQDVALALSDGTNDIVSVEGADGTFTLSSKRSQRSQ